MSDRVRPGAVVFARDHVRLAQFYAALTNLSLESADDSHSVLASDTFELVLHAHLGAPAPCDPVVAREESAIKLFFVSANLAQTRQLAATLGGKLKTTSAEWEARGFRACDGMDPEGNVIQFRQEIS